MLGRVLVEVGYASLDDVQDALRTHCGRSGNGECWDKF